MSTKAENQEQILEETLEEPQVVEEAIEDGVPEKSPLEIAEESIATLTDRLMRTAAEYDNFKKRTQREKDELYATAVCNTIAEILPVLDNLERAVNTSSQSNDETGILEGVSMIVKQFQEALSSIGVEAMDAIGKPFDPQMHNAVMTAESDEEENTILEEFMKGYVYKDKVVRHAMVKVSN